MKRISGHILLLFLLILASCSTTKYVPKDAYLLNKVNIASDSKELSLSDLKLYVRQNPNSKWFNLFNTQLYIYNLSSRTSQSWFNKMLRRLGDAPVIYNRDEALISQQEITRAVRNMGYMSATVQLIEKPKKKKIAIEYRIDLGDAYRLNSVKYEIEDPGIAQLFQEDSTFVRLKEGMIFNVNQLDQERAYITDRLLNKGYFKFNKDYISYEADTVRNTYAVDLRLKLRPYGRMMNDSIIPHKQYKINKVSFITDYDVLKSSALTSIEIGDSLFYKGYSIYYKDKLYLRPSILVENTTFAPNEFYNAKRIQRTYSNFGRLSALKYTNMRFIEVPKKLLSEGAQQDSVYSWLNCYILLTRNSEKSISFDVEGTNSAGDLGAAASISYQNRNLFKGSETFTVKLRGAYEVISGLEAGYRNNNYIECGIETDIKFPNFVFPFLSSDYKKKIRASTGLGLQYSYQLRPEFLRTMASASWNYSWQKTRKAQHRVNMLDVAFLYVPWASDKFKEDYIEKGQNYIFQYNYQNRLIISMGYRYNYNSMGDQLTNRPMSNNSYSIRFNIESAGNLMYLFSKVAKFHKDKDGEYTLLDIPFSQYIKGEIDFVKNIAIDPRNSLVFHAGLGVAIPYGNAKTIPFEKQYFAGGANGVRGWSVRNLGPGTFPGDGNQLNQSGDIKINVNLEYRSRLFWKLQGAAFVDAGNIWTARNYANQPGGEFKFDQFYKQIALSYGLGLRLDLDFFILRFDGGMKALNPVYSSGRDRFPFLHPNFKRDFAFHFAIGYPF